jgi:hypothetical protein
MRVVSEEQVFMLGRFCPQAVRQKKSKKSVSWNDKQKFTAVICIISSYTYAYIGWKAVRKKESATDNKLNICTGSEIIVVNRTFFV